MFNFFDLFDSTKRKKRKNKSEEDAEQKQEFSKTLLVQESLLIWIHTIAMLVLAYICVFRDAYAELPWLTAMVALPWTAYGVSQHAYYKKAQAENTKDGIIYETAMAVPYTEIEDCR